ncbi:hypothetical protein EHP00_1004 [Ecytonucleospora hepatopenaei]|uniref:Uncharacterized protein n=1 Tax=Ecytonucleospora hepatopenaei TaxID=646526 RepID=A0A1W0E656_9MICR|nr:hypothetical protein EHP00_1004 [Ecytonucleospora hepatopenaei]
MFLYFLNALAKIQLKQSMVFENEGSKYFCELTLEPATSIDSYHIYKNHTGGDMNKAKPVFSSSAKHLQIAGDASKYKLEIPVGPSKVKKDSSVYSFKFKVGNKDEFSEPFAWDSSSNNFNYAELVSGPWYKSIFFIITMCCLGAVVVAGSSFLLYKKMHSKANKLEDEDL